MKLLQNRLVVGALVVVAAGLLAKALWPVFQGRGYRARQSVPPAPVQTSSVESTPAPVTAPLQALAERIVSTMTTQRAATNEQALDWTALQNSAARWSAAPRRDPFQARGSRGEAYPPAMQLLKLTAVWRQTGGALATINNRVLTEGDPILKFKIEKIESDAVWVQGPNGREQVHFSRPDSAFTNSPVTVEPSQEL